jgi:hypothetical protein
MTDVEMREMADAQANDQEPEIEHEDSRMSTVEEEQEPSRSET